MIPVAACKCKKEKKKIKIFVSIETKKNPFLKNKKNVRLDENRIRFDRAKIKINRAAGIFQRISNLIRVEHEV